MPTLTWDANTEPDLANYRVYHGTRSPITLLNYNDVTVVAAPTTTLFVTGFNEEVNNYFVVSAVNTSAQESPFSNEVSWDNRSQQLRIPVRYIKQYA